MSYSNQFMVSIKLLDWWISIATILPKESSCGLDSSRCLSSCYLGFILLLMVSSVEGLNDGLVLWVLPSHLPELLLYSGSLLIYQALGNLLLFVFGDWDSGSSHVPSLVVNPALQVGFCWLIYLFAVVVLSQWLEGGISIRIRIVLCDWLLSMGRLLLEGL